jgi:inorganic triphosphatase YgiF
MMSPTEIELKLALPGADPARVAAQLTTVPRLAAVPATELHLSSRYFDTPERDLSAARVALRLRSVRQGRGRARWVQTLKTAGAGDGSLSSRNEWEAPVRSGQIDPAALQTTAWPVLDTQGKWLAQLAPCFETTCVRTLRRVPGPQGSLIEVALDVGDIRAGDGRREALLELELELIEGTPDDLFDLAEHIAQHIAVLPSLRSKAERGWRLADGTTHAPRRARPPALHKGTPVPQAAQAVLAEALGHGLDNLNGILASDGDELVHQARVGWRRWRSALWLFKPLLAPHPLPDTAALGPLRQALGALRDLDVAALDTLPPWSEAFIDGDAERAEQWQTMEVGLSAERRIRRAALLSTLSARATGQALVALERWLYALPTHVPVSPAERPAPRKGHKSKQIPLLDWARARTHRLRQRLKAALHTLERTDTSTADGWAQQHRVRLLAKRTRYVLMAVHDVLPTRRSQRWQTEAADWQTRIGDARDLMLLGQLLEPLGVDRAILGFLRGVAAARSAPD